MPVCCRARTASAGCAGLTTWRRRAQRERLWGREREQATDQGLLFGCVVNNPVVDAHRHTMTFCFPGTVLGSELETQKTVGTQRGHHEVLGRDLSDLNVKTNLLYTCAENVHPCRWRLLRISNPNVRM